MVCQLGWIRLPKPSNNAIKKKVKEVLEVRENVETKNPAKLPKMNFFFF